MKVIRVVGVAIIALTLAMAYIMPILAHGNLPPKNYEIWTTNQDAKEILILDGRTLMITDVISSSGAKPHMITFTADYQFAYVSNVGETFPGGNNVDIIRTDNREIVSTFSTIGKTHAVVASPDNVLAYVNNLNDNLQEIIRIIGDPSDPSDDTFSIGRTVTIGDGPGEVEDKPVCVGFTADGSKAYATNAVSGTISVIDVASASEDMVITGVGTNPCGLALSEDAEKMYVTVGAPTNKFMVIDVDTDTITDETGTLALDDPHAILETPDEKYIWIVNRGSDTITVVDADTFEMVTIHETGKRPDIMEFSPDGKWAFLITRGPASAEEPAVSAHRVVQGTLKRTISLGPGDAHGLAVRLIIE